jgi:hypothetical protein
VRLRERLLHHFEQGNGVAIRRPVVRNRRQAFRIAENPDATFFAGCVKSQNQHRESL